MAEETKVTRKKATLPVPPVKSTGEEVVSLKDMYYEWFDANLANITDALEANFPNRWDMTKHGTSSAINTWLASKDKSNNKSNREFLNDRIKNSRDDSYALRAEQRFTFTIHFPELTVSNSDRKSHKIHDFFITLEFGNFLTPVHGIDSLFRGRRTSYTLAEYLSGYSFSHLSANSAQGWGGFCLGSTNFATLCRDIATQFDADKFYLWCVQLPDYLSWESLEGGPYRRIRDISERSNQSAHGPSITSAAIDTHYKKFLQENCKFDVKLIGNPYYYTMEVLNNDTLVDSITSIITDKQWLMPWDPVRKTYYNDVITNRKSEAERVMRDNRGTVIKFKGQDIEFKLLDMENKSEEKDDKIRKANPSLVVHIHNNLQSRLNQFLRDELRKGK